VEDDLAVDEEELDIDENLSNNMPDEVYLPALHYWMHVMDHFGWTRAHTASELYPNLCPQLPLAVMMNRKNFIPLLS